jgi:hypothetical protein
MRLSWLYFVAALHVIHGEESLTASNGTSIDVHLVLENGSISLRQVHINGTNESEIQMNDTFNASGFLSFEEWKKAKGADNIPSKESTVQHRPKSQPLGDTIGEEMEIDITHFFTTDEEPEGKTYSKKFNFASFDCAATIVKTNSEAKSAMSILVENKDSYLLNPCSAPNKFVVVELCQDILVDSVVLANYEFFSSTFKRVRLSVSESFPVSANGWKMLGEFTAKDIRDVQEFNITNPMVWAKYFRVEILEHYGNEYYCPLSIVRVHGRTMMQEYKQEEQLQQQKMKQDKHTTKVSQNSTVECLEEEKGCHKTVPELSNLINETLRNVTAVDNCPVTLPSIPFNEFFLQVNSSTLLCPTTVATVPQSSTAQESIYKNIMKRLSQLESNATLSILYIEEQSKLISSAFEKLESRHRSKVESLMHSLNVTIHSQVNALEELYIQFQIKMDDVFKTQRTEHESLLEENLSTITRLEADLQFQKVLSAFNAVLLFCVFFYVVLTRDTMIETEYHEDGTKSPTYRAVSRGLRRLNNSDEDDGFNDQVSVHSVEDVMVPSEIKRPMTPPSDRE